MKKINLTVLHAKIRIVLKLVKGQQLSTFDISNNLNVSRKLRTYANYMQFINCKYLRYSFIYIYKIYNKIYNKIFLIHLKLF